jgi:vacuolar-type H+-ATPase subunit I/STV1
MSPRTVFLAKLFGLYYLFAALSMILHKQRFVETVTALLHDTSVMFLVGILTLLGGLALVLAHNVWSRGALAVVVTLVGWITLAKGLLFLFLTPEMEVQVFLTNLHYAQLFYMYAAISLVLGVYLAYGGFTSGSQS